MLRLSIYHHPRDRRARLPISTPYNEKDHFVKFYPVDPALSD